MGGTDCIKQWSAARRLCRKYFVGFAKPNVGVPSKKDSHRVTGGYTDVDSCARGLVSEACGGNKVDYGEP